MRATHVEQSGIPFSDPAAAERDLQSVAARLSPALAKSLPALLEESPDPDSAVLFLERFFTECSEAAALFEHRNFLLHYAVVVFGHSRYLGETLIQNPDLLQSFLREKNLDRSFSQEEFEQALARLRSRSFETDISPILARFRRREYVRIMLRDVLKLAPLSETAEEISALSDVLIDGAWREANSRLQRRYGMPRRMDKSGRLEETPFAILSFGKLGGNELNYCSDVDLLYIFGDGDASPDSTITNHEYFVRLAQEVTEILSCITPQGPVFRIDLRLRPQGNEGELAVSVRHALRYYAISAHDWERQALIKLRHSGGDTKLARAFIRRVQPYVYSFETIANAAAAGPAPQSDNSDSAKRSGSTVDPATLLNPINRLNFSAIKTALEAREKIAKKGSDRRALDREEEPGINVKLGRGGIRDIEFLVQCLQRVYGGAEPWLRSRGTLFALQKLHDKGHISGHEFQQLTSAYEFLRHLEHRLQLQQGRQTHRLPISGSQLQIVQRAMEGYAPGEDRGGDLLELVRRKMAAVAEIYERVIDQHDAQSHFEEPEEEFRLHGSGSIVGAEQSNREVLERLAADAPAFYKLISTANLGAPGKKNLFRFLSSAFTSSERYATLLRYPVIAGRTLALFETSDYLTEILVRHPEEVAALDELNQGIRPLPSGVLFDATGGMARTVRDPVFEYLAENQAPHAEKIALLRRHYRRCMLLSGARDVTQLRGVYESLAETTAATEDAIRAALRIAEMPAGLAVMALGRLGSGEFDLLSDADLLFVCEEGEDVAALGKFAGQFMQALAAYTRDGMLFPVDTRLRPRGAEGELVVTVKHLSAYFQQEAQAWEALTYAKMRLVGGSREVGDETMAAADELFQRFAGEESFLSDIVDMRAKLERAEANGRNLKTAAGGTYDVDFLTNFLLIKNGQRQKHGTLRDRLWRCAEANLLQKSDVARLDHAAEFLRTVEHVVRLVSGRTYKWLPPTEHARDTVTKLTERILGRKFAEGLEMELSAVLTETRTIYGKVMSDSGLRIITRV
jgi:[glutamine synthetase] adenylyltransferase / [glutamine synthetase]-adenylyl-L-tyrosine phosphorylase